MNRRTRCTGLTASWCPRCGDCTCPGVGDGGWPGDRNDPGCPLHAPDSPHAARTPDYTPRVRPTPRATA